MRRVDRVFDDATRSERSAVASAGKARTGRSRAVATLVPSMSLPLAALGEWESGAQKEEEKVSRPPKTVANIRQLNFHLPRPHAPHAMCKHILNAQVGSARDSNRLRGVCALRMRGCRALCSCMFAGPDSVAMLPALVRLRRMPRRIAEARAWQGHRDDLCLQEVQESVPQGCCVSELFISISSAR